MTANTELHRVMRTVDAANFCGVSVQHFRRLYRQGRLPRPVHLSDRRLGWRLGDLIVWVRERVGGYGDSRYDFERPANRPSDTLV